MENGLADFSNPRLKFSSFPFPRNRRSLDRRGERARYRGTAFSPIVFESPVVPLGNVAPFKCSRFRGWTRQDTGATERATRSQPPIRTHAEGDRSAFTLRTYPCGKTQIRTPLEEQEQRRLKSSAFLAGANFRCRVGYKRSDLRDSLPYSRFLLSKNWNR